MKKNFFLVAVAIAMLACNNANSKSTEPEKKETGTGQEKNNEQNKKDETSADAAKVSFKVNGVEANTRPNATNDKDKQLGLFNYQNNFLNLSLMGDDPKFPHRGFLTLSVEGFKMEPSSYTMSKAFNMGFSRYATENAGGETQYSASVPGSYGTPEEKANNAKRNCTLIISKVEKVPSEFGERYLMSGTFTGTLSLSTGFKNEVPLIEITEGKFENVEVTAMGKRN